MKITSVMSKHETEVVVWCVRGVQDEYIDEEVSLLVMFCVCVPVDERKLKDYLTVPTRWLANIPH
jgi:hypothetical protein